MPLHIDNSAYARKNIVFGRVVPWLVTISAMVLLVRYLVEGVNRGTAVPALLAFLWITYMVIVYIRRGRHPAVKSIEFLPDCINVDCFGSMSIIVSKQIHAMEYEGLRNRARVEVVNASFPKGGERILVISLTDLTELRVKVHYEHDAPLKEIASRAMLLRNETGLTAENAELM